MFMKRFIHRIFCLLARLCILRHKPFVVGITGSFGKTTARNLIYDVLRKSGKDVYTPEWNYNGEWWLVFAVLRIRSEGKSLIWWLKMLYQAMKTVFGTDYPRILVLEYGVDHIGEMDVQLGIVEPDIALITTLSPSHIEWFGTTQLYYAEKKKICRWHQTKTIINADDINQLDFPFVFRYGYTATLEEMKIDSVTESLSGLQIQCVFQWTRISVYSPFLGQHLAGLISWAYSVLRLFDISHEEIQDHIKTIQMPYGRGNVLVGIDKSLIIDGTYNGGFDPIVAWAEMLCHFGSLEWRKTLALIGDMRELWPLEIERHKELWNMLQWISIDHYVFVWNICKTVISPLIPESWREKTFFTLDSREAGVYMSNILSNSPEEYLIFAKGSQNTLFLEEALKKIVIADEQKKLVRQDEIYLAKKELFFQSLNQGIS